MDGNGTGTQPHRLDALTADLFGTFWTLTLEDIAVPKDLYKKLITASKTKVAETQRRLRPDPRKRDSDTRESREKQREDKRKLKKLKETEKDLEVEHREQTRLLKVVKEKLEASVPSL